MLLDTCQAISSSRLISPGPAPALLNSQGCVGSGRGHLWHQLMGKGGQGLRVCVCRNKEAVAEGKGEQDRNEACSKKRLQLQSY